MNIFKIRIVIAAVLAGLVVLFVFAIRSKFQRSHHTAIIVSLPKEIQPTPASEYHDPVALEFAVEGKDLSSVSPYDVERFMKAHKSEKLSFKNLWKLHGFEAEEWSLYEDCKVAHFNVSLDSEPDTEILQRLYDKSGWSMGGTRYLIWKKIKTKKGVNWKLLDHVDFEGQRYTEPDDQILTIGKKHFLIVNYMTVHGSGAGCNSEEWYELQGSKMKSVLGYPSWSFEMGATETEGRSKVVSTSFINGVMKVKINFLTKYRIRDADDKIVRRWSKTKRASFIWSAKKNSFVLKRNESNITQKEVDKFCNL
jgi:hypothetical protein